jgi:hypothetical protein
MLPGIADPYDLSVPQGRLNFRVVQSRLETEAGAFHLVTTTCGSGRVPHVRLSVHGPKTDSSNAFTPCSRTLALGRSLLAYGKSVGWGCARLFRPMYAGANMGHPSREEGSVFAPTTATPMNSTRFARPFPDNSAAVLTGLEFAFTCSTKAYLSD